MDKLKTLKDLEKFSPEDPYCMMETLEKTKDKRTLNSKWYNKAKKRYVWISENKLRQEAIKHIKFYRDLGLFGEAVSLGKFFNITEEDLK